jgi:hypothetical protein
MNWVDFIPAKNGDELPDLGKWERNDVEYVKMKALEKHNESSNQNMYNELFIGNAVLSWYLSHSSAPYSAYSTCHVRPYRKDVLYIQ